LTPFDILKTIPTTNLMSEDEVIRSGLSQYLLIQYLKNHPSTLYIGYYLSQNMNMSVYDMYLFAFNIAPKNIGYIKRIKSEKKQKMSEEISCICKHYVCSEAVAEKYSRLLTDNQKQRIIRLWKEDGRI
jgi:hypothetical protein